ncbi:MAG: hypothetical protein XD97_0327 [Pelotomaculum thermopropionicum]|uniref:Uncharacterized protein n=1 Tax=Pelotomaculum thermopropionicum TaxID=110500 RepID=A0A101HV89_9FIRM|nr:MAG: hypothetical protein XD97_0327 [Pelotomaculum thermopropionicum]
MGWGKPAPEPNGNECGCCITIEADFVFIFCGENDIDDLSASLQGLVKAKDNTELENQE